MNADMLPAVIDPAGKWDGMPSLVSQAGGNARFAWEELFSAEIRNPAYPAGLWPRRAPIPGLVRGAQAGAAADHARLGGHVLRRAPCQHPHQEAASFGPALLLRPAGAAACGGLEPGGVGSWGSLSPGGRQDARDHGRAGARAAGSIRPRRRRGPPRPGDRRHSDLHRRPHRRGGRTQDRQLRPGRRAVVSSGSWRKGEKSGTSPCATISNAT